jgi:hypothetical protein
MSAGDFVSLLIDYTAYFIKIRNKFFILYYTVNLGAGVKCPEIGISSIDWAQQSRFCLRTGTEPSFQNVVF